jgi:hypothetical protein
MADKTRAVPTTGDVEALAGACQHTLDVIENAKRQMARGAKVFFKWTCGRCGARQTFETPNVFHVLGKCEECAHLTDLRTLPANVNFLLMQAADNGEQVAAILEGIKEG